MRRSKRTPFQRQMWVLHVLIESGYENRTDLARKLRLNPVIADRIFGDMVGHGLIREDSKISKRGINYRITRKGAKTYKLAAESYENVGMNLIG